MNNIIVKKMSILNFKNDNLLIYSGTILFCLGLIIFFFIGTKVNESAAYAQYAWIQMSHPELKPGIDYEFGGGLAFFLPYWFFFRILGFSMESYYISNYFYALFSFFIFLNICRKFASRNGLIVFLLCSLFSIAVYHEIYSSYWAVIFFFFAASVSPLFLIKDKFMASLFTIAIAWTGVTIHEAALGIAAAVSLLLIFDQSDNKRRIGIFIFSVICFVAYSIYPLVIYNYPIDRLTEVNRIYAGMLTMANKSGILDIDTYKKLSNLPSTFVPDVRSGEWKNLVYWVTNYFPTLLFSYLVLFSVIFWIIVLNLRQKLLWRSIYAKIFRDSRLYLLLAIPLLSGIGYSLISDWGSPLLLRFFSIPYAVVFSIVVSISLNTWSYDVRRSFWISLIFALIISVFSPLNISYMTTSRTLGLTPVKEVAKYVEENTLPGDTVFSGYVAIGIESKRPALLKLYRGNQSGIIYDGSTIEKQIIFYELILSEKPAVVVLSSEHWRDREVFRNDTKYGLLEEARASFLNKYNLLKKYSHPSYKFVEVYKLASSN